MPHHKIEYTRIKSSTFPYSEMTSEIIAKNIIEILKRNHETLAIAESLTGGSLMALITSVDGSSSVFRGGMVTYATQLKHRLLGVDAELILEHGVVDGEVALQMALGVQLRTSISGIPTTWGVSTTGVAGPGRSDDNKECGTVFIGVTSDKHSEFYGPFMFERMDRDAVRKATAKEALVRLLERIDVPETRNPLVDSVVRVQVLG